MRIEASETISTRGVSPDTVTPELNRAIGFSSLLICIVSGMILGLWSFGGPIPVPQSIGDYADLPRRFLRLGHIAFFGLGIINLVIAGHCMHLAFRPAERRNALRLMNAGNVGLPPLLIAATWLPHLIYLMPLPVGCVLAALALTTAAALRTWRNPNVLNRNKGGCHENTG